MSGHGHGHMGGAGGPKSLDMKTLKRLLNYFGAYKPMLWVVVVLVLVSAIASAASSLFLRTLIDDYITPMIGVANPDFMGLLGAIGRMCLLLGAGVLSTLAYSWIMAVIAQRTMERMRNEMFEKMQGLPIRYFDSHEYGDIMSLYTNDVDTLRQMMMQTFTAAVSSFFTIITVFFSMLSLSVWLTLLMVVSVFFIGKVAAMIAMKSGPYFMQQQQTLAALDGYVEEIINGLKVVKVFSYEGKAMANMSEKNVAWREASRLANGHATAMMPIMNGLGYMQFILVALVGAALATSAAPNLSLTGINVMTVGMIASFLTLARNFSMPITQLSSQMNAIITALAGAARVFALLDEPAEVDEGKVVLVHAREGADGEIEESDTRTGLWAWKRVNEKGVAEYRPMLGDVVMEHVNFGYKPDKQILHDINLYAKPGQKVAFVGATGAGKTTITNLINRFYDINDGTILYDGIDITHIKKDDLRRSMGIVLQDVNLFTDTVMENIRYGNPQATDDDCIQAAKLANADGFIKMLPDGYNTVLSGDGAGLSQGQRQLLSIARAAVSDPPVMILDEATSSIDTRTEAIVQDGMDKLMHGRTVFVIAHRLSTIQNADVVMVMDHGRIIERGNHDQLMAEHGTYYQLYTGAFELD
ncbi:MAG: ABC transporter ATP-binding protein [Peptococcaceae bacterium]